MLNKLYILILFLNIFYSQSVLTGKIFELTPNNVKKPLIGANLIWLGTSIGTSTNENGEFSIPTNNTSNQLKISFIGYKPITLTVSDKDYIEIFLEAESVELNNVNVTAQKNSLQIDYFGVENKTTITKKELQKAACCNLSDSFETNASIDVSFTDAVTGTKQIEMLGLSGIYTQTSLENLPYIRALISTVGLSFLPGTWINAINLSKGVGSVINGYESITGQIDVEMAKPKDYIEKPLFLNIYADLDQRFEANVNYGLELSEHLSLMTFLHASSRKHKSDMNSDNFIDMPTFDTYTFKQKWQYHADNGWESQLGYQFYKDKREGGSMNLATNYVYKSDNSNFNVYGKTGYVFQDESGKTFGFQWSLSNYKNNAQYGMNLYNAKHNNIYLNFIYQSDFGVPEHSFRTGISFNYDKYSEEFKSVDYDRIEKVPGIFGEYTYKPNEEFSVIAGLRYDNHNYYGNMITPRFHLKYAVNEDFLIRATVGRGFRTSNIFVEYASNFVSSRDIIINKQNDYGFGLNQEKAWNYGLNFTYYFLYDYRESSISVDLYRTDFEEVTIANLDNNTRNIEFSSAKNGSYSNSLQFELMIKPFENIETRFAYRYMDVQQKLNDNWLLKPFSSKHRAFINFAYSTEKEEETDSQFLFDFTLQWYGKKRIPSTLSNPLEYQIRKESPDFVITNAQVTYSFNNLFDLYLGAENIFDFKQDNPIISSNNPLSNYFDASLIWGPINGRMIYTGLRYKL